MRTRKSPVGSPAWRLSTSLKVAVSWRWAEARLEGVEECMGGEALEIVSIEHTLKKAEYEGSREMGSS